MSYSGSSQMGNTKINDLIDEIKKKKVARNDSFKSPRMKRRTLALNAKQIEEEGGAETTAALTEQDEIQQLKTEIEELQREIKAGREHSVQLLETQKQNRLFQEQLIQQRNTVIKMKTSLKKIITRDVGSRVEVEESAEFMGDLYVKVVEQLSDQIRSTEDLYSSLQKYMEDTCYYQDVKSDFDKFINNYNAVDAKLQKMNNERKPNIDKIGQLQVQKEETFNAIKNEGKKVIDVYNDMYNQFLTSILHSSVDLSERVSKGSDNLKRLFKDKGEKVSIWKTLNIGEAVITADADYPSWMDPLLINIYEAENHFVEKMEYCVVKYAKSILCNPTLATTGISVDDIDLIFADIETIHNLHARIFSELRTSTLDSFINAFISRAEEFYAVYQRRCTNYNNTIKCLRKCMKIPAFHDVIETIDNTNSDQPRLEELLRFPFTHLEQMIPLFTSLKDYLTEPFIGLDRFCTILTMLSQSSEQAEMEHDVDTQLSKIHKKTSAIPVNQSRKYIDRIQCVYNRVQGTVFIFSDMMVFTHTEKNEYVFDALISLKQLTSVKTKNKKIVTVEFSKEEPVDLTFRDISLAEKCMKYLNSIKYKIDEKRIFNTPVEVAAVRRDEDVYLMPTILHAIFDRMEKTAPLSEGIFRLSGSIVELQKAIEQVDLQKEFDLQNASDDILAGILKKYLLSIPNKLPSALKTLDGSPQEMIEPVKRLLIDVNNDSFLCLMDRLFLLLHLISKKSDSNKMTASNLALVIAPNVYEEDDSHALDLESNTRAVTAMIEHYDEIFGTIHDSLNKKIEEGAKEVSAQKELQCALNKQIGNYKPVLVSSLVTSSQDDNTVVLTLKDIVKQEMVEMLEGKRWTNKWVVLKRNCLMVFRNIGEGQTLMVLPLKTMTVATETKMDKECILLRADKQSVTLHFENNEEWLKLLTE